MTWNESKPLGRCACLQLGRYQAVRRRCTGLWISYALRMKRWELRKTCGASWWTILMVYARDSVTIRVWADIVYVAGDEVDVESEHVFEQVMDEAGLSTTAVMDSAPVYRPVYRPVKQQPVKPKDDTEVPAVPSILSTTRSTIYFQSASWCRLTDGARDVTCFCSSLVMAACFRGIFYCCNYMPYMRYIRYIALYCLSPSCLHSLVVWHLTCWCLCVRCGCCSCSWITFWRRWHRHQRRRWTETRLCKHRHVRNITFLSDWFLEWLLAKAVLM